MSQSAIDSSANAYASGTLIGLGLALAAAVPIILASIDTRPSSTVSYTPAPQPETAEVMPRLPLKLMSQTVDPNAQRLTLSGVHLDQLSGMPNIWVHEILTGEGVRAQLPSPIQRDKLAANASLWRDYAGCTEIMAYPAEDGGVVLVGVRYGIADVVRFLPAVSS